MAFSDNFFKKIEKKTNVNKDTILSLAKRIQNSDMKDENILKDVIHDIANMTGREVTEEQEQRIIDTVMNDQVPKDLDKYID